ncbi:MBL fold metallo-hydrolase, partial [Pseudomonas aeruginosa]
RLELLDDGERSAHLGEGWRFHFSEGHTPGQMLPEIAMPDGPVVFSGDLIPGAPWVHLPLTMGYDRFPEGLIEEKERLLDSLIARNGRLVFTHDPCVAMGRVRRDEQERYSLYDTLERVENLEA